MEKGPLICNQFSSWIFLNFYMELNTDNDSKVTKPDFSKQKSGFGHNAQIRLKIVLFGIFLENIL